MLKLSSPWQIWYREVEALFGEDPDVRLVFDDDEYILKMYVDNPVKADAIAKLMPQEKVFGSVTVKVMVIPANEQNTAELIRTAFNGNPVLNYVEHFDTPMTGSIDCVVFRNEVVQFFVDDLMEIHGLRSTLYQDIAPDALNVETPVKYCTDLPIIGNSEK